MKTIETKVYEYDELSDKAKERAREWWINGDDLPFLSEYMHEQAIQLIEERGIKHNDDIKVYYSLAYCQGDDAMFEGSGTYKDRPFTVKQSGHYYHAYSKMIDMPDASEKEYREFEEIYTSICKKLEKDGYAYIEEERDEERVAENIRANEYTFTEDGKRFG